MNDLHAILLVVVTAAVTILLRAIPFLIFGGKRKTPAFITYLSQVLPYAIMGMLVVYCLRNVDPFGGTHGIPELISCAAVVLLHVWRRNTLLSIALGTAVYMLLVQLVF